MPTFLGQISTNVLTVSQILLGGNTIAAGQNLTGLNVPTGLTISSQSGGTSGGAGTYLISASITAIASEVMSSGTGSLFPDVPSFPYPVASLPIYSSDNFLQAFLNLLPRGRAWAKYLTSNMATALATLMPTYARSSLAATNLLIDLYPGTTTGMMSEWAATVGLPDPCWANSGLVPTPDQTRNQILARLINTGGQSVDYMIAYAEQLGFIITVTEQNGLQTNIGQTNTGFVDGNAGTAVFTWFVRSPTITYAPFETNITTTNSPLAVVNSNTVLECELNAIAPAETNLLFLFQ